MYRLNPWCNIHTVKMSPALQNFKLDSSHNPSYGIAPSLCSFNDCMQSCVHSYLYVYAATRKGELQLKH